MTLSFRPFDRDHIPLLRHILQFLCSLYPNHMVSKTDLHLSSSQADLEYHLYIPPKFTSLCGYPIVSTLLFNMKQSLILFYSSSRDITCITDSKKQAMLFKTIVEETCSVAIGPLEYCGNGKIVNLLHGQQL